MNRWAIRERFNDIVEFAGVERFLDTPVKRYSSGMYLRLAFSVAAHLEVDVLLVDEVLAVGDAEFQRRCLGRMASIERGGRTVVFVSHNLDAIVRLCDTCVWLDKGSVVELGPAAKVVDSYLSAGVQSRNWRTFDAVTDRPAVLRSVGLLNPGGQCTSVLRRDEPFDIEVRLAVLSPVPDLNIAVAIQSLRGIRVLQEALSDTRAAPFDTPGEFTARVRIPPILNAGDYVVNLWLGTDYEDFAYIEEALSLHLEGGTDGRPDRVVQLRLPWELIKRGHP
jgi:ABC-2 type transport system ATP-binding protein/lipopolysaccharide transport system ATP-binding protein